MREVESLVKRLKLGICLYARVYACGRLLIHGHHRARRQRSFTRPSQDTQPPQRTTRPSFTQRSFTRPSQDTQQDTQPPQRLSYTELRNAVFDSNKRLFLHYFPGQYQKAIIFAKYCDANGLLVSYSMFDVRLSEFRAAFPPVDIEEEPHEPIEEEPHEPIEEEPHEPIEEETDADISKE